MPTSGTGISNKPSRGLLQAGFSLLELLVVVAIIGIVAGAVVLSIHITGPDRQIEHEVDRLRGVIDLLHEEALLQSHDFGVLFTQTGYRFYVYDYAKLAWAERPDDRLFAPHDLTVPLTFALSLEDRDVKLPKSLDSKEIEKPVPQVMILSSGELTPFTASVYRDRGRGHFDLTGALDGTLEVAGQGFDSP